MKQKIRLYSVKEVAIILLLGLSITLYMNAGNIYRHVTQLNDKYMKTILLFLAEPLYQLTRPLNLDATLRSLRKYFLSVVHIHTDQAFHSYSDDTVITGTTSRLSPFSRDQTTHPSILVSDSEETVVQPVFSSQHPLSVLMIGDSLLSGAIAVMFERAHYKNKTLFSELIAHPSSGLSRPDYYNWQEKVENIFSKKNFDAVIILLGTNDAQTIVVNEEHFPFDSPGWISVYKSRLASLLLFLKEKTYRVYWIGLPPMRSSSFHRKMMLINGIIAEVCSDHDHVTFIPTLSLLGNEKKLYTDFISINNTLSQLRLTDGIHLTYTGGKLVADMLLEAIRRDFRFEEEE
jgi:hypothetical protein